MDQLLSIKRIPIKIEVNVTNAEFKRKENSDPAPAPAVTVSKQSDGAVVMQAQPYRIDVASQRYDSFSAADMGGKGLTLTYDAVAKLPLSADAPKTGENAEHAARNASRSIHSILNKLPKSKNSSVSYNDGTLSINYQMSKPKSSSSASEEILDLSSGFEFIPGRIEFVVTQMPGLEIEYVGDPIYFPRSADPNYQGEMNVTV